jgi:GGDEF domain-containing protein
MWIALFFVWLFVLYNIERLHKPINLASFVYVLAGLTAVPFIVFAPLARLPAVGLLIVTVPLTIGLKARFGYSIGGTQLPLTITEIAAVWVTTALALQLGRSLQELRNSALNTLLVHLRDRTQVFEHGQSELYREVRRARNHRRPLALLAISATDQSIEVAIDRFTRELHEECVHSYVSARVAELLSEEMKDCSVVSHHGEHFVTVVPEADRESAMVIADKLKRSARDKLGLELSIGISLFPDEEVTFVQLLERAQAQLESRQRQDFAPEPTAPTESWSAAEIDEQLETRPLQDSKSESMTPTKSWAAAEMHPLREAMQADLSTG